METCYKAFRREVIHSIPLEENLSHNNKHPKKLEQKERNQN